MCRLRDAELNCVSTKIRRISACRQLLMGMSISRFLPPDWHGWLRAVLSQREQPRPLAAAEDDREDFVVHRHALRKAYTRRETHM